MRLLHEGSCTTERESIGRDGESDMASLSRGFTDYGPKEIQRNECATHIILCEGESVSAWIKSCL